MSLFANYVPFKIEFEKYISNCKTVFEQIGDRTAAALVDGLVKDIEQQRYLLTIVGSFNRGKSTLLNTLMERQNDDISPISFSACTSAIVKYIDKAIAPENDGNEKAIIYFDSEQAETIPLSRIKKYVTEEENPGNRKGVRSVEVYGDFPEWSKAVTIVDSPGQNSTYNYHDTLLTDFLPYTDAIIFLVAANLPLDGGDINLLRALSEEQKKKIFFVLTKADDIDEEERNDVVDYVKQKIEDVMGSPCEKLYVVSAKPVYEALCNGVSGVALDELKAKHGLAELEEDLEKFIVSESNSTTLIRNKIKDLMEKTSAVCNTYITDTQRLLSDGECAIETRKSQKAELIDANQMLKENAGKSLRKFNREWTRTLAKFDMKFSLKADAISNRIQETLQKGGFIGAVFQSFKLQQAVEKIVAQELNLLVLDLQEQLEKCIKILNSEFDEELGLYVKRKGGKDKATIFASGGAAVAMGGAVTVGASATAGAIQSAMTAYAAWQGASAAATAAAANASVTASGLFPWLLGAITGHGGTALAAKTAAAASAKATIAGSAAISAGIGAVITGGITIAGIIVAQKLLKMLLVSYQESHVPVITEKVMQDMQNSLMKALEKQKEFFITEYQQWIDDTIADNTEKLEEIEKFFQNNDPNERLLVTKRLEDVKALLAEGVHVQKQLPTLQ